MGNSKILIALLGLLLCPLFLISQNQQEQREPSPELQSTSLTPKQFNKALNQEFSNLLSGQENNAVGSYASVDIENSSVTFAPNINLKNGNIIVVEFKGGVSDGTSSVFSNNKLNTNVSANIQYHFINRLTPQSLRFKNDLKEFYRKKKNIEDKGRSDLDYLKNYKQNELKIKCNNLEIKLHETEELLQKETKGSLKIDTWKLEIDVSKDKIESLRKKINGESDEVKKRELKLEQNKLRLKVGDLANKILSHNLFSNDRVVGLNHQKQLLIKKIDSVNKLSSNYSKYLMNDVISLNNKVGKQIEELEKNYEPKLTGFNANWFSVSYKVKNDEFKLLNSELELTEQIRDTNFVTHEVKIQHSWYKYNLVESFKTIYVTNSIGYGYTSTFGNLNKVEINEVENLGTIPGQRTTSNQFNAYVGDYREGISEVTFNSELYYFLFKKNKAAFHFYPEYRITEDEKPITNLGLGVLFAFKDKKNEKKSIVNAELFYDFLDVFKNTETDLKLFERNSIGLRFTFPIQFKNN